MYKGIQLSPRTRTNNLVWPNTRRNLEAQENRFDWSNEKINSPITN